MNLARQGAQRSDECSRQAEQIFEEKTKDSDRPLNLEEYVALVKRFLGAFEEVFIVIDALDEASEKESILNIVTEFLSPPQDSSEVKIQIPRVKVLMTSREDLQIRSNLERVSHLHFSMHESIPEDVAFYVKMDVQRRISDRKLKLRNKSLASQICDMIIDRAGT